MSKKTGKAKQVSLVLKRRNGRIVKRSRPLSRYAAKQMKLNWEAKYDSSYYVEVESIDRL